MGSSRTSDEIYRDRLSKCGRILRKLVDELKSHGSHVGNYDFSESNNPGNEWSMWIESESNIVRDLRYEIRGTLASENVEILDHWFKDGKYDWASGTYIKPISTVTFTFK